MGVLDMIPGVSRLKLRLIACAAFAVAGLIIAGLIYRAGQTSTQIDKLKDTVKAHETSDRISSEVDEMGLVARCLELGGMPDKCDELRGLDPAASRQ
jgi:hypothetical protein